MVAGMVEMDGQVPKQRCNTMGRKDMLHDPLVSLDDQHYTQPGLVTASDSVSHPGLVSQTAQHRQQLAHHPVRDYFPREFWRIEQSLRDNGTLLSIRCCPLDTAPFLFAEVFLPFDLEIAPEIVTYQKEEGSRPLSADSMTILHTFAQKSFIPPKIVPFLS
jgi:hypothetical protein